MALRAGLSSARPALRVESKLVSPDSSDASRDADDAADSDTPRRHSPSSTLQPCPLTGPLICAPPSVTSTTSVQGDWMPFPDGVKESDGVVKTSVKHACVAGFYGDSEGMNNLKTQ